VGIFGQLSQVSGSHAALKSFTLGRKFAQVHREDPADGGFTAHISAETIQNFLVETVHAWRISVVRGTKPGLPRIGG
jgi:hypothetical protein